MEQIGAATSTRELQAWRRRYYLTVLAMCLVASLVLTAVIVAVAEPPSELGEFHSFTARDIEGKEVDFARFVHKVVLVINVASECGFTLAQYDGLEQLYRRQHGRGLEVLAFPSNSFQQETWEEDAILRFVREELHSTVPLMEKVAVNGRGESPVFSFLKRELPGDLQWNFEKARIAPQSLHVHCLPASSWLGASVTFTLQQPFTHTPSPLAPAPPGVWHLSCATHELALAISCTCMCS